MKYFLKLLLVLAVGLQFNLNSFASKRISILINNKTDKTSHIITDDSSFINLNAHDSIRIFVEENKIKNPNGFSIQYIKRVDGKETSENYLFNIFELNSKERVIVDSSESVFFQFTNYENIFNAYFVKKIKDDKRNLDSLIFLNRDNIISAKILFSKYVLKAIDIIKIDSLFKILNPTIKKTIIGREIDNYLKSKIEDVSFEVGSKIKNIILPDLNDRLTKLNKVKSKYILLDFWFAGCIPCIMNFDTLKTIYSKTDRVRFEVVAISIDKRSNKIWWRDIISRKGYNWINLIDSDQNITRKYFKIVEFPTSFLLDREKHIIKVNPSREELEHVLN